MSYSLGTSHSSVIAELHEHLKTKSGFSCAVLREGIRISSILWMSGACFSSSRNLPEVMQAVCRQVSWLSRKGLACCITLSCWWRELKCRLRLVAASPFLKAHANSASSWLAQHWEGQEIRASGLLFGSPNEETHHSLSPSEWFVVTFFDVVFLVF